MHAGGMTLRMTTDEARALAAYAQDQVERAEEEALAAIDATKHAHVGLTCSPHRLLAGCCACMLVLDATLYQRDLLGAGGAGSDDQLLRKAEGVHVWPAGRHSSGVDVVGRQPAAEGASQPGAPHQQHGTWYQEQHIHASELL